MLRRTSVALLSSSLCLGCGPEALETDVGVAGEDVAKVTRAIAGDLTLVVENGSYSDTWWRSPEVSCSNGETLLGGGASILNGDGHVLFRGMIPYGNLSKFEVAYQETPGGYGTPWAVNIQAICHPATSIGKQLIEAQTSSNSNSVKTLTVHCPEGKKVVGTGGTISGSDQKAMITKMYPSDDLQSVIVEASEYGNGTGGDWRLRGFAVCANSNRLPGLQLVKSESAFNSISPKAVTAVCPSTKSLLGTGAQTDGNADRHVLLEEIQVVSSNSGPRSTRVKAREAAGGNAGNWHVTSYAICANGVAGDVN